MSNGNVDNLISPLLNFVSLMSSSKSIKLRLFWGFTVVMLQLHKYKHKYTNICSEDTHFGDALMLNTHSPPSITRQIKFLPEALLYYLEKKTGVSLFSVKALN